MEPQRERILETLHAAATEIQECETVEAACERTITAAEDVLEFEMCSILLHDDGWLEPVAMSSGSPADGARRMATDQGLAGKTFQTNESYVVDSIEPDDETDPARGFYRSGMSVPVGDVGVFQAVADRRSAFDGSDVEFAELLMAHTARTIDRLQFERELQEQQAAIRRQNEKLEEFASVVSHDLRNPLSVARGHLELAETECDSEHLDAVEEAHDRMETLIEDLLALAREGTPVEEQDAVDLGALVQESWQHVDTSEATLTIDTDRRIRTDPNRLRQLFENLLRNAIEHGGNDVTVGDLEDDAGFYVADDGPGVPADERERVFERGYSTRDDGTGFGLAIVQEIVEAHGWEIAVTDSADGGTRFEITGVESA